MNVHNRRVLTANGQDAVGLRRRIIDELSRTIQAAQQTGGGVIGKLERIQAGVAKVVHEIDKARPFRSFGEQLQIVARAALLDGDVDERLVRAPVIRAPTGLGEVDPSTGGFAVADAWVPGLITSLYSEAALAPLTDRRETSGPLASVKVPGIDETSRADGSRNGGALAYWSTEGASINPTLPRFRNNEFSAKKLIAVAVTSAELVA